MSKVVFSTIFCGLLALLVFAGGCKTLSRDGELQIRKYSRLSDLNRRMLAEDVDKYLLLDRPSRLTELHVIAN